LFLSLIDASAYQRQ